MALKHSVYDTDAHFKIDAITRQIKNDSSGKTVLIQGDHNSERFTFEVPRLVDGHDLSLCDAVQVHYINIDSTDKTKVSKDLHEVDDLQISPDDGDVVILSWLIDGKATRYAGSLNFAVKFKCTDGGVKVYEWNTMTYTGISISSGIDNGEVIVEDYSDVLEQWEKLLFEDGVKEVTAVQTRATAAINNAKEEALDEIATAGSIANEQIAQAVFNIDPNCHAEYFTITDDGVVSLKPEYRGACPSNRSDFTYSVSDNGFEVTGSKNTELPRILRIPEVVNEVAVVSLAAGMFMYNRAVELLVLPYFITDIPDRFCDNATHLRNLYNTENVRMIGMCAFQKIRLEKAVFPNLTTMGTAAFNNCPCMIYADVGNITSVPQNGFATCERLSRIKGGANITTIAQAGFGKTNRLKNVEFLQNLTSIGNGAFLGSRIDYDWDSLGNCTFGTYATSKQLNPTDIWSGCNVVATENPLPTMFNQEDPRWADKKIGGSLYNYGQHGCIVVSAIHAYCGIRNLEIESVEEFEEIVNNASPGILDGFSGYLSQAKTLLEALGLTATLYTQYTQENLQKLYDAVASGGYVLAQVPGTGVAITGHVVTIYGVKENKELMFLDSDPCVNDVGINDKPLKYAKLYQTTIEQSNDFLIVTA